MSKNKTRKQIRFDWEERQAFEKSILTPYSQAKETVNPFPLENISVASETAESIQSSRSRTLRDFFDEEYDSGNSLMDNNRKTDDVEIGDDDDISSLLPSSKSCSLSDYFAEEEDVDVTPNIPTPSEPKHRPYVDSGNLPEAKNSVIAPAIPSPNKNKKDNSKRLTLQDMQNAIVNQVPVIAHNGG